MKKDLTQAKRISIALRWMTGEIGTLEAATAFGINTAENVKKHIGVALREAFKRGIISINPKA